MFPVRSEQPSGVCDYDTRRGAVWSGALWGAGALAAFCAPSGRLVTARGQAGRDAARLHLNVSARLSALAFPCVSGGVKGEAERS